MRVLSSAALAASLLVSSALTADAHVEISSGPAFASVVTVYEDLDKMTIDYPFVPSTQGDWFLLLRNSGPTNMDIQVRVGLYGAMTWIWQ